MDSPFTEQMLDDFRRQGDPLADRVIQTFADACPDSVDTLISELENMIRLPSDEKLHESIHTHFSHNPGVCHALETYFSRAVAVPDWLEKDKLLLGEQVFQDHLFSGIIILGCASLPVTYSCSPDVKVLGFTRRLIDDAPRRLVETAQMVTDVMRDGGIHIENNNLVGSGVRSILKIRLIHAAVRYLVLNRDSLAAKCPVCEPSRHSQLLTYISDELQQQCHWYGDKQPERWQPQKDGIPINQEALGIILLTFSYLILHGLGMIGVKLNHRQQQAYLHAWNVAGYLLGVDEILLQANTDYKQVEVIFHQILVRRRGKTEDGILLQQALLEAFVINAVRLTPFARLLHVRRLGKLITTILVTKPTWQALGLKLSFYDRIVRFFVWMGLRLFGFMVNFKLLRPLANFMFGRIARSLWNWRQELSQQQLTPGTCKPLHIPSGMEKASHAAGFYKSHSH